MQGWTDRQLSVQSCYDNKCANTAYDLIINNKGAAYALLRADLDWARLNYYGQLEWLEAAGPDMPTHPSRSDCSPISCLCRAAAHLLHILHDLAVVRILDQITRLHEVLQAQECCASLCRRAHPWQIQPRITQARLPRIAQA